MSDIVSSYMQKNTVSAEDMQSIIVSVYKTLQKIQDSSEISQVSSSDVTVENSVQNDYIVCLEDGKKLQMLKRHLSTVYNMTPEQYKKKWGLPHDYPMVAPKYAKRRSEIAKVTHLGRMSGKVSLKRSINDTKNN